MKKVFKAFTIISIISSLFGCTQTKTITNGYSFESPWASDEHSQWHACTDEGYAFLKKDEGEHTPSEWIIDEEPTASKQGKKHKQCTVCGHHLVEETIDKIPDEVVANSNLIFTQLDSGNYSVKAASQSVEKVIIPSTYDDKPVTIIEKFAFKDCSSLTSITIPDSVTSISYGAFYNCNSLISIIIPDSVTSIAYGAFRYCSSLTSITIPNSVAHIDEYVFDYCQSLKSITIPDSVTSIGKSAFENCSSLTSITIPNSVTSIGRYAFRYCSSLNSITIPNSVTSIDGWVFAYCTSLNSITIPNSVTSIDRYAFSYCSFLETINFVGTKEQWNAINKGEGWNDKAAMNMTINCVGDVAFTELDTSNYSVKTASTLVEEVVIPSTYKGKAVTKIENNGFRDCSFLKSIFIPNSIASIGNSAFYCCSSLQTINFDGTTKQWNAINKGEGWNDEAPTSMVINCVGDYLSFTQLDSGNYSVKATSISIEAAIIPNMYKGKAVTKIENNGFRDCSSLKSIFIPNSIASIGNSAFHGCSSLTSISIPNSGNSTSDSTFQTSFSFSSFTIPKGVTSIGAWAFGFCTSLTSIAFYDNVTYIGNNVFDGCSSLRTINFLGTLEQWNAISKGKCWDGGTPTSMVLKCLYDYLRFTQLESGNYSVKAKSTLAEEIIIPRTYKGNPVTKIENDGFRECQSLKFIAIPNSVTSIGECAFAGCFSLTSITIPNSVTSIDEFAFGFCTSLTSITIPNSVTSIGDAAFSNCKSLISITIPDSVTSIGVWAFGFCTSLTSINIPDTVTSIGDAAFSNCKSLISITIPDSVTSIGERVFRGCSSLKTINFDGTTAQWNAISKSQGWNDGAPKSIEINCGGDLAFTQLDSENYSIKAISTSVEVVVIPNTYNDKPISVIEEYAFYDCTALTSIMIPNTITSIGAWAFGFCTSLTSITIPNTITSIGTYAFGYCTSFTSITIPNSVTSIRYGAFTGCTSLTSITIPNSVTYIGNNVFDGCSSLKTINFDGTTAQWNAISKSQGWNDGIPTSMLIHCSNGDINL